MLESLGEQILSLKMFYEIKPPLIQDNQAVKGWRSQYLNPKKSSNFPVSN